VFIIKKFYPNGDGGLLHFCVYLCYDTFVKVLHKILLNFAHDFKWHGTLSINIPSSNSDMAISVESIGKFN
jgi:hypothetical protein